MCGQSQECTLPLAVTVLHVQPREHSLPGGQLELALLDGELGLLGAHLELAHTSACILEGQSRQIGLVPLLLLHDTCLLNLELNMRGALLCLCELKAELQSSPLETGELSDGGANAGRDPEAKYY